MRQLGNMKLALMCERFDVEIEYSNPVKIDLFALHILDLIAHSSNFRDLSFKEALTEMGIPADLFPIYEDRFHSILKFDPALINDLYTPYGEYLLMNINNFILSKYGRDALQSKELPSKIEKKNVSLVYDYCKEAFIVEGSIKKADLDRSVVINVKNRIPSNYIDEMLQEEFNKNIRKYVPSANSRTKIYKITHNNDTDFAVQSSVQIIENDKKICLYSDNLNIMSAVNSANLNEKSTVRTKMFTYLELTDENLNLGNAIISTDVPEYKAAFFNDSATKNIIKTPLDSFVFNDLEYHSVGLDNRNQPLLYKYSLVDVDGFMIPMCEKIRKDSDYQKVYDVYSKKVLETLESNMNIEILNSLMALTINKDKENVLKNALKSYQGDFYAFMDSLNTLYESQKNNQSFKKIIQDLVCDSIKSHVASNNMNYNEAYEYLVKFELNNEIIIKFMKNNFEMTDELVNKLLLVDEKLTNRVFELVSKYNDALTNNCLTQYNHRTAIYSDFLNYSKQMESMKSIGFNSYYDYKLPKNDWGPFMAEVRRLEGLYNRVKLSLTGVNKKGADDFFGSIHDIYYELSPVTVQADDSYDDTGDFFKDMEKAVNGKNPMFVGLAATIRLKYSEVLHSLEAKKDNGKAKKERMGYKLISYVIEKKSVDEVYNNWRNLCILVHFDTEKDNPLVKGDEKAKRRALMAALNTYRAKLFPLEGKMKDESY